MWQRVGSLQLVVPIQPFEPILGVGVRFATVRTDRGLRLHVKGTEGYVDVGDATGNETLSTLAGLAYAGDAGLAAARGASERTGVQVEKHQFGPATPDTPRILCLGVNYA